MKKWILILLLCSYSCFSQILVSGTVKDATNNSLPYANVIAKPKDTTKNMSFAITDEEGRYRLKLVEGNSYTITVSYLGFEAKSFEIDSVVKNKIKNIVLNEAGNQLDEVIIELPVVVKQDTIIYNTSKFVNGKERKLKNILKKLPGIEVDKDGSITVLGKKVTKLLVDDKPFFGGGTKLGVENIPADAVAKVEVLDNYNEVAFLKNVSDSDEMAMNIKLKEDKKRFIFGDVEAGKGNETFYKAKATTFYYSPKTNINFIGNSNTIGEKTFTFKDYLDFEGGVNAIFKDNSNFKSSDLNQFFQNTDILESNQQFGALNVIKTTSTKLDISGYAIFSKRTTSNFQTNENQYIDFTELQDNNTNEDNILGIGKFMFDFTPNSNEQWYFKAQVKRTNNVKLNTVISRINLDENIINTSNDGVATLINQNIEWHYQHSNKHTFSAIADYTFDKNNSDNLWQTTTPILQDLIPLDTTQENFIIAQNKETEQHYFNTTFKDFWVLNRNNHIYTSIGNTYQQQRFLNNDYQILDNNLQNSFTSGGFNNTVNYINHDFFVGVHYKFRTGIFTFKQGAYAHLYDWNVEQETSFRKQKWVVLPDFLAKIEFSKSKKVQINYNLKTGFADVTKLANRFYLSSYNAVFKGNDFLENELYHSARIRYSRFSMFRGLMMNVSANYIKRVKGFQSTVNFEGINRYLIYELLTNPLESIEFRSSIKKRINQIRYFAKGSYKNAKNKQVVNLEAVNNSSKNFSYELGAETLFDNFPTVELGYKRSVGNYVSSGATSKFITNEPFVTIDYDFFKSFAFKSDYVYYDYKNETQGLKNSYQIANASLLYQKEDSPWTYEITAQNLFNTTFKQSNSFSDYLISDTKTYIMPRAILFSIGYKL